MDPFLEKDSITVAGITTELLPTLLFRVPVIPNDINEIERRVGELGRDDIERLGAAIMVFLGLAWTLS